VSQQPLGGSTIKDGPANAQVAGRSISLSFPSRVSWYAEHRQLINYCLKRLAFIPLGVFIIVTVCFALVNLVPVNPGRQILGDLATTEAIDAINRRLGFDLPISDRYVVYMKRLAAGDLGTSFYTGASVRDDIARLLPRTLELTLPALVLAFIFGLFLGWLTARTPVRLSGRLAKGVYTVLQATPEYVSAVLLILILFSQLHWAAAPLGRMGIGDVPPKPVTGFLYIDAILGGRFELLPIMLNHAILPTIVLVLGISPLFARISRSNFREAMSSGHVEFARASGLPRRQVFGYVLRSARAPLVTVLGLGFAGAIGGAAIIESIFSWGGIGQWAVTAMQTLDLVQVQGFVLLTATTSLVVYLLIDIVVAALDPRISYGRS